MSNFSGSYKFSWKRILRPIILFILYAFFFLKPANYIMYIRSFQFLHYLVILSFLSHTFNHAHYYYWNFDFEIDRIPKNVPNYSKFPDTKLILHLSTTCCHSTAHSQQAPSTSESSCTVRRFKYHKQNLFLSAEQYLISFSLYLLLPPPPPPPLPSVPFVLSFFPPFSSFSFESAVSREKRAGSVPRDKRNVAERGITSALVCTCACPCVYPVPVK